MRRNRIDLGQKPSGSKEASALDRKRARWAARNKNQPSSANPFLEAIRPKHENFGDPDEKEEELRKRLQNLEFGNFPGYFNYRKKAVTKGKKASEKSDENHHCDAEKKSECEALAQGNGDHLEEKFDTPLESGISDERLRCFKREWLQDKNVLDIGCNRGHITYAIAQLFDPKSITGIDIDLKMIQMANRDIHLHLEGSNGLISTINKLRLGRAIELVNNGVSKEYEEDDNHFPLSSYISGGPISNPDEVKESNLKAEPISNSEQKEGQACSSSCSRFPNNLVFIEHNYVLSKDELVDKQKPFFDTIVCLSVTKWIHLNYCDAGLKRFFKRMYRHLNPGGLLILEAQPFDNYGRRKKLSDRLKANFYSIQLKPEQFDAYLLSEEVGFKRIVYETMGQHECAGFKRPIKVFEK